MKLLMKLQAGISFKNPDPYSPRTINHKFHHHNTTTGFSGPMIPEEARRRRNVNKFDDISAAKDEPTSPKISCMGQIKQKKNKIKIVKKTKPKSTPPLPRQNNPFSREHPGSGFWTSRIVQDSGRPGSLFGSDDDGKGKRRWPEQDGNVSGGGGDGESRLQGDDGGEPPRLGQLKKFASGRGRDTLSQFDWKNTTQDRGEEEEEDDEEAVIISYSAPIMMTGGGRAKPPPVVQSEQNKEINLWKRRTMAQPQPLHLK